MLIYFLIDTAPAHLKAVHIYLNLLSFSVMWRENKSHWNIVRFAYKVGGMALCLEIRRGKCPFLPGSVAYVSVWISTDFVLSVRLQIIMLKLDSVVSVPQWHSRLARRTYRQYEKCEGREFDPPLGNCCFCSFFFHAEKIQQLLPYFYFNKWSLSICSEFFLLVPS